ncbi:MAG: energy transducer TonB [Candidatus Gastranaerophilaceae bacterium]
MKKNTNIIKISIVLVLSLFISLTLLSRNTYWINNEAEASTVNSPQKPFSTPKPATPVNQSQKTIPSPSGSSVSKQSSKQASTSQENTTKKQNIEEQMNLDFGPYMRNMQRKIKSNWNPPKKDKSEKVVLLYTLNLKGEVQKCTVIKSSGSEDTDNAAKDALYKSAPFGKLPSEYKGKSIDVQFTFDYNVFGASTQDRI